MEVVVAVVIVVVVVVLWVWGWGTKERLENCNGLRVEVIDSGKPGPCVGLIGGVHGNEPAGAVALNHLLKNPPVLTKGKLIVIPEANRCGLINNTRWQSGLLSKNRDLNRNFTEEGGTDIKSQRVVDTLRDCEFVIDIHEGWGFHRINPASLGSTLSPVDKPLSMKLADRAVTRINRTISDPDKKFTNLLGRACEIPNTLNCHMARNGKEYILIEITGQNDIQPIDLRRDQALFLINSILEDYYGAWSG